MYRRHAQGAGRNGGRPRVSGLGISVALLASLALQAPCFASPEAAPPSSATVSKQDALDAEYAGDEAANPAESTGFPDPLEGVNRTVFFFNRQVDRWLLNPITRVYRFVVPDPAKRAVRRAFANLASPSVLVNDLLQREWKDAGVTAGRLVINSTFGMAGLVDPAAEMGLSRHESDFGQTLALMGVSSGPFLVLPILGPTNVRDSAGYVVDLCFRPTTWLIGPGELLFNSSFLFDPGQELVLNSIQTGGSGLALREEHSEELRMLEESSLDFYAALRNAYYQHRTAEIWSRRESHRPAAAGETRSAAAGHPEPSS